MSVSIVAGSWKQAVKYCKAVSDRDFMQEQLLSANHIPKIDYYQPPPSLRLHPLIQSQRWTTALRRMGYRDLTRFCLSPCFGPPHPPLSALLHLSSSLSCIIRKSSERSLARLSSASRLAFFLIHILQHWSTICASD
jgi:hypothetical protein